MIYSDYYKNYSGPKLVKATLTSPSPISGRTAPWTYAGSFTGLDGPSTVGQAGIPTRRIHSSSGFPATRPQARTWCAIAGMGRR